MSGAGTAPQTGGLSDRPVFYYDLGSPECWLAAERVNGELPEVPVWQPVHLPAVLEAARAACGEASGRPADDGASDAERRRAVESGAAALALPAVRWPEPFPADTTFAMHAATYAQTSGRAVAFSLAAFRQAFAAGRDLGEPDNVLLAAAACELHFRAVLKGVETRAVRTRLAAACADAAAAGVRSVPALRIGSRMLDGLEALERAGVPSTA